MTTNTIMASPKVLLWLLLSAMAWGSYSAAATPNNGHALNPFNGAINGNGVANNGRDLGVKLYTLSINSGQAQTVALFSVELSGQQRLLVSPEELPRAPLADGALDGLPRYTVEGCDACVDVEDLGRLSLNERDDAAALILHEHLMGTIQIGRTRGFRNISEPQTGAGAFINYRFSGVDERRSDEQFAAAELELGLSLGRAGSLRGAGLFQTSGDNLRGDIFLEKYFQKSMTRLALGDSFARAGEFGSASRFAGIQLSREFGTQPGFLVTPGLEFTGATSLPAVIDLYVDGQRQFQQSISAGQFELRDTQTGSFFGPEVEIVVRDAIGDEQIIQTRLFGSPRLLRKGVSDYSIEMGSLRVGENDYEGLLASATYRRGFTNYLTLEVHGEAADETELVDRFYLGSMAASFSTPIGNFTVGGAYSESDKDDGSIYRLSYEQGVRGAGWQLVFSGDVNYSDNFRTLGSLNPRPTIYRASTSGTAGRFAASLSFLSDDEDLEVYTAALGVRLARNFFIGGAVRMPSEGSNLYSATLTWVPGRNAPRMEARYFETPDTALSAFEVSGGARNNEIFYLGNVQHREDSRTNDTEYLGELYLSYDPKPVQFSYTGRFTDDIRRQSVSMRGAVALYESDLYLTPRIGAFSGYGIVDVGLPGTVVAVGADKRKTNYRGRAAFSSPAFQDRQARVDQATLPEGYLSNQQGVYSVHPGQRAFLNIELERKGFILILATPPSVASIRFNEREYHYDNDFGAYITNATANGNMIEVDGRKHKILIPPVSDDISILKFSVGSTYLIDMNGEGFGR